MTKFQRYPDPLHGSQSSKDGDWKEFPYQDRGIIYSPDEYCDRCTNRSVGVAVRETVIGTYSYPLCDDCLEQEQKERTINRFERW